MSILTRNAPVVTVAAFAMLCLVVPSHDAAFAASKKSPQAADAAAAAKKSYEGGVKAYQAGRFQNAVDQLSSALRGGGLSSAQMARGLYYRGLSYKKLDKPGLAISDITSALWLKNGLSDDERKMATAERAEAYKSAGLGDGNSGADRVTRSDPKTETPAPAAAPAAVAAAAPAAASAPSAAPSTFASTASQSSGGGVPQPLSMGAETAAVAPPPNTQRQASPPGVAAFEQSAVGTGSTSTSAGTAATSTGIGTFFSNLFSGGSSSTSAAPAAEASGVTTASTSQAMPQSSSWANGAPAAAGAPPAAPKATKTAAAEPVPPPVPAPVPAAAPASTKKASKSKTSSGKYKLHIAALRSRAAADALAQKLMQEHAKDLHDRQASVDEAVIGSMGTFYRVRVGSYKTAEEPRGLCNTLRNSGYDCLVVSN